MKSVLVAVTAIFLTVLTGCKSQGPRPQQSASEKKAGALAPVAQADNHAAIEPAQSHAPSPADLLDPAKILWETRSVDDLGLELPVIQGVKLFQLPMAGSRSWQQQRKPISTAVWAGPGNTVEGWSARMSKIGTLGKATKVSVCGVTGTRQELSLKGHLVPAESTLKPGPGFGKEMGGVSADGRPVHPASEFTTMSDGKRYWQKPAQTSVVLGFERNGTPILARWTVETARRQEFAAAEKHFFGAISCKKK